MWKSDRYRQPPEDVARAADEADAETLKVAQHLLQEAMADVAKNGLFITGPRGCRQRNPAAVVVGQQQRIITSITKAMRAPRRPGPTGVSIAADPDFDGDGAPLIDGIPCDSELGQYLLAKPDRLEPLTDVQRSYIDPDYRRRTDAELAAIHAEHEAIALRNAESSGLAYVRRLNAEARAKANKRERRKG